MVDVKEVIGWMFGAFIAVGWIGFALLGPGNMVFLVVALSITIMCGSLSGGLISVSRNMADVKEAIGWVFGASIAVAWIVFALLEPGSMVFLFIALAITIVCGTVSGGLIALSKGYFEKYFN